MARRRSSRQHRRLVLGSDGNAYDVLVHDIGLQPLSGRDLAGIMDAMAADYGTPYHVA